MKHRKISPERVKYLQGALVRGRLRPDSASADPYVLKLFRYLGSKYRNPRREREMWNNLTHYLLTLERADLRD